MFTGLTIFRLVTAALLPVLVTVVFYLSERKNRFHNITNIPKQILIGITFGVLAILATEFGIPVDGAVLNVRNAAPLTAGLVFGWPAGIIAGLLGGIERWFSNAGDYTRLACTLGTIIAGIFGASVRKFMLDNKKASWFYGLAVGVTTEVLHMLLVFLTNADDIHRAFSVVEICAVPMIVANSVSVMLSIVAITALSNRSSHHEQANVNKENIAQTFQRWLLVCVVLAFGVTAGFNHAFQNKIAYSTVDYTLRANMEDVRNDIRDVSNRNLLNITNAVANALPQNATKADLMRLAEQHGVTEINIIDKNGIIVRSTNAEFVGFDMASGEQSAEFLALLNGEKELVQEYQPITLDADTYCKYAGVALEHGFVQVGYDSAAFYEQLHEQVQYAAQNRHIGQDGFIIICDENGTIVSDRAGHEGEHISIFGDASAMNVQPGERVSGDIYGKPSFLMYTEAEGYFIIAVIIETIVRISPTAEP